MFLKCISLEGTVFLIIGSKYIYVKSIFDDLL